MPEPKPPILLIRRCRSAVPESRAVDEIEGQEEDGVSVGEIRVPDVSRDVWLIADAKRRSAHARREGGRLLGLGRESAELRAQRRRRRPAEERVALVAQERWDEVAAAVIDHVVRRVRSSMSHRHPYHPEILNQLEEITAQVLRSSGRVRLGEGRFDGAFSTTVDAVEQVAQRIEGRAVEEVIRDRVEHYRRIAQDPEVLMEPGELRGEPALLVQHKASGMRAAFTVGEDGFGRVYSKSNKIGSIDPNDDGRVASGVVDDFYGLGIGQILYLRGAQEFPGVRWASGNTSAPAKGLRSRLHRRNPYTWEGPCQWCPSNEISWWEQASEAQFAAHPR